MYVLKNEGTAFPFPLNRVPAYPAMSIVDHVNHSALTLGIVDNDAQALRAIVASLRQLLPEASFPLVKTKGAPVPELCADERVRPEIMLVDMSLEDMPGISLCAELSRRYSDMKLLAMTSYALDRYAARAAEAGAQGLTHKGDVRRMAQAIVAVRNAGVWNAECPGVTFPTRAEAYARSRGAKPKVLSVQESAVVEQCAQGLTDAEIAQALGLSVTTVHTYLNRAKDKLEARNRANLVALWLRQRM